MHDFVSLLREIIMSSENIKNWCKDPIVPPPQPPRHISKFDPKYPPLGSTFGCRGTTKVPGADLGDELIPNDKKDFSSFGPQNSAKPNPKNFLKGTGRMEKTKSSDVAKFVRPSLTKRKPAVPSRDDRPVMGLTTSKNFIVANAVENILAVPKQVETSEVNFMDKPDYGKVPEYLQQVKATIAEEERLLKEYLSEQKESEEEKTLRVLAADEREDLIYKLKLKWDDVNKKYQNMAHLMYIDTMTKQRRKEHLENSLQQIEKMIQKLQTTGDIVIQPDY